MKKIIFINIHAANKMKEFAFGDGGIHTEFYSDGFSTGNTNIIAINPTFISFKFDSDSNLDCIEAIVNRAIECDMFVEKIERFVKPAASAQ